MGAYDKFISSYGHPAIHSAGKHDGAFPTLLAKARITSINLHEFVEVKVVSRKSVDLEPRHRVRNLDFRPSVTMDNFGFILTLTAEVDTAGLMGAWKRYSWLKAHKDQLDVQFGKRLIWIDQLLTIQIHRQWPEHVASKGIQASADEALSLLIRLERAVTTIGPTSQSGRLPSVAEDVPPQIAKPENSLNILKDPPF